MQEAASSEVLDRVDRFVSELISADMNRTDKCSFCTQTENLMTLIRHRLTANEPTKLKRPQLLSDQTVLRRSASVLHDCIDRVLSKTARPDGSFPAITALLVSNGVDHLAKLSQQSAKIDEKLEAATQALTADPGVHKTYSKRATFRAAGTDTLCTVRRLMPIP